MKVLIVGLRKEQNTMLRKKYTSMSIDALDDKSHHHRIVHNPSKYDRIISLTKFTNHTTHTHYRKHPGYTMISGGYSSVNTLLESLPC